MAQASKLFDLSMRGPAPALTPLVSPPAEPMPQQEGPRKLVRPRLPEHLAQPPAAPRRLRGSAPLARHEAQSGRRQSSPHAAASQAESFYLQKQIQAQTAMVFILENGEQVEGVVEWFDRDSIKVRNSTRVLVYKRSIKYLYKAKGDSQG